MMIFLIYNLYQKRLSFFSNINICLSTLIFLRIPWSFLPLTLIPLAWDKKYSSYTLLLCLDTRGGEGGINLYAKGLQKGKIGLKVNSASVVSQDFPTVFVFSEWLFSPLHFATHFRLSIYVSFH